MRPLTVLAGPWSAWHRNRARNQTATFGTFDGATSSYGVTLAMFVQHQPPAAFVAPVVGLAIASAAGMGVCAGSRPGSARCRYPGRKITDRSRAKAGCREGTGQRAAM